MARIDCGCGCLRLGSLPTTTTTSPLLSLSSISLRTRRENHQFSFPRGHALIQRQEKLRKADRVPETAELIFLLPKDRWGGLSDVIASKNSPNAVLHIPSTRKISTNHPQITSSSRVIYPHSASDTITPKNKYLSPPYNHLGTIHPFTFGLVMWCEEPQNDGVFLQKKCLQFKSRPKLFSGSRNSQDQIKIRQCLTTFQ